MQGYILLDTIIANLQYNATITVHGKLTVEDSNRLVNDVMAYESQNTTKDSLS